MQDLFSRMGCGGAFGQRKVPVEYKLDAVRPKQSCKQRKPTPAVKREEITSPQPSEEVASPSHRGQWSRDTYANDWGSLPDYDYTQFLGGLPVVVPPQLTMGMQMVSPMRQDSMRGPACNQMGYPAGVGQMGYPAGAGQPKGGVGQMMGGVGQTMGGVGQTMGGVGYPMIGVGYPMSGVGQTMGAIGPPMGAIGPPMAAIGPPMAAVGPPMAAVGPPQMAYSVGPAMAARQYGQPVGQQYVGAAHLQYNYTWSPVPYQQGPTQINSIGTTPVGPYWTQQHPEGCCGSCGSRGEDSSSEDGQQWESNPSPTSDVCRDDYSDACKQPAEESVGPRTNEAGPAPAAAAVPPHPAKESVGPRTNEAAPAPAAAAVPPYPAEESVGPRTNEAGPAPAPAAAAVPPHPAEESVGPRTNEAGPGPAPAAVPPHPCPDQCENTGPQPAESNVCPSEAPNGCPSGAQSDCPSGTPIGCPSHEANVCPPSPELPPTRTLRSTARHSPETRSLNETKLYPSVDQDSRGSRVSDEDQSRLSSSGFSSRSYSERGGSASETENESSPVKMTPELWLPGTPGSCAMTPGDEYDGGAPNLIPRALNSEATSGIYRKDSFPDENEVSRNSAAYQSTAKDKYSISTEASSGPIGWDQEGHLSPARLVSPLSKSPFVTPVCPGSSASHVFNTCSSNYGH